MYLQRVIYQMQQQIENLLPCFHRSERRNLALMVVGMVYARSVNLPQIASFAPVAETQLEARVQRFERVLNCPKLVPLTVLKPVAEKLLTSLSARQPKGLMILMDRSMINDGLNLLWVAVAFGGRALPLGWVEVPHEGNSDLALQQELLSWLSECLPEGTSATIVADREFHSIHLARWIAERLQLKYVLRIKAGTCIEFDGQTLKAGELAIEGESLQVAQVKVTRAATNEYRTNLSVHWASGETEAWILATNLELSESLATYRQRFWIEEMFSDQKSRGLNLEQTRLKQANRVQRLLVAVTLAYLWLMEIGSSVLAAGEVKKVDNRGLKRSVSLCQVGFRWLRRLLGEEVLPPILTINFSNLGKT